MKFRTINSKRVPQGEKPCGVSKTDKSQHEPITRLIARMTRGEIVASGSNAGYDAQTDDEASFAGLSPSECDGFDMADIQPILARGKAAIKKLEAVAKIKKEAINKKATSDNSAPPKEDKAA